MTSRLVAPASPSDQLSQLIALRPKPLAMRELPPARGLAGVFPVERRNLATRHRLMCRVRAEFDEMPGLSLTLPQARRLFGLPLDVCDRILNSLADEGLLRRRLDGRFGRRDIRP
jgi:hypothetical protein